MFSPNSEEVTVGWRELYNEEVHHFSFFTKP
jgi:hypothetical protein